MKTAPHRFATRCAHAGAKRTGGGGNEPVQPHRAVAGHAGIGGSARIKVSSKAASRNPRSVGKKKRSLRRPRRINGPRQAREKVAIPKRAGAERDELSAAFILTIGHSTRPIAEFVRLLRAHAVTRLIDVRTVPRSRHNPQFSRDILPAALRAAGISYLHRPALGGLRRPMPDSPNTGWRNLSFRGYADHMQTSAFHSAVTELIELARGDRLALMCAEAVPWRCHRSLIADALLVRGIETADISSATRLSPHRLTPFAKVRGTKITYPAEPASASRPALACVAPLRNAERVQSPHLPPHAHARTADSTPRLTRCSASSPASSALPP
jgi:hypothetical protein